jgi:hypothetical protein
LVGEEAPRDLDEVAPPVRVSGEKVDALPQEGEAGGVAEPLDGDQGLTAQFLWELAGIFTAASGFPRAVGLSFADGVDRWGGGDAPRANLSGDAESGSSSFAKWFNTDAITAPGFNDFGNAPPDVFRGPGITNWDFSVFKRVLFTESIGLQLRFEFYNFLNHSQWDGVDTSARFDAAGNQVNGRFGQVTSARNSREAQVSLRLEF